MKGRDAESSVLAKFNNCSGSLTLSSEETGCVQGSMAREEPSDRLSNPSSKHAYITATLINVVDFICIIIMKRRP